MIDVEAAKVLYKAALRGYWAVAIGLDGEDAHGYESRHAAGAGTVLRYVGDASGLSPEQMDEAHTELFRETGRLAVRETGAVR